MATTKIAATSRATVGTSSAKALRKTGQIPAVVYGHGGPTISLAISLAEIQKALADNTQTFELSVEGKADTVLLCDAQFDLSGEFVTHVDFKRVSATETVEVDVEVRLKGEAIGLKTGGKLDHTNHSVKVKCLPTAIPEFVLGHVDALDLGDILRASELELPAGVELAGNPEQAIAAVQRPGGLEEEAPAEGEGEGGEDGSGMPEVIGKGGDDAEGGEGEGGE